MNGSVPHIVQYQGSKRNLAPQILPYFPQRFNRLIEPFAGMAAITIAVSRLNKLPIISSQRSQYTSCKCVGGSYKQPPTLT